MAATDSRPVAIKNTAYRVYLPILDADGDLVTGATGLDSEVSKDGGTFADCTNEATEIATSSGMYYLDLTSTEMNADAVCVIVKTTSSGAKTTPIVIYPQESGDIKVDVQSFGGTAGAFASGRPEVNTTHAAGTAWASGAIVAGAIAASALNGKGDWNVGKTGYSLTATTGLGNQTATITGNLTGSVGSVTGAVGSVTGAVGSVTGNVGGNVVGSVASVTAGVTVTTNNDKTGYSLTATTGLGNQTANITGNLSGSVGSVTGAVGSVTGLTASDVGAIKAKTDNLPAAPAAVGDIPTAAAVADAVWDEAISGHLTAGSTGNALNAAGSAGDPWSTPLPGAYGAGTAGKIIGDNIDATVSSRLATSGYSAPLDAAAMRTAVGLASANLDTQLAAIAGYIDTEVGTLQSTATAIKAKTDNLPASPAAVGDIPTATQNADALLNRDMSLVLDTSARSPLNAFRFIRNKWSVSGGTLTVTKENDSTTAWTATLTQSAGADPVTGSDPA